MKKQGRSLKSKRDKTFNSEEPEIYAIKKGNNGVEFSRKEFIGTLSVLGAGVALNPLLSGCKKDDSKDKKNSVYKSVINISTRYWYAGFQFSPDASYIVSYGSAESAINLWSVSTGKLLKKIENTQKFLGIKSVEFTSDGACLVVNAYTQIDIWSMPVGTLLLSLAHEGGENDQITQFALSPDGKNVAYNKYPDSSIKIYSVNNGQHVNTIENCFGSKNNFRFSPDGNFILSGYNTKINLFSFPQGNLIKSIETDTESVTFEINPDGKSFATNEFGKNGTIKIWTLPEGKLIKTIETNESWTFFDYSQDGKLIASWGSDNINCLWSVTDGSLIKNYAYQDKVLWFCFSPDKKTFASCSEGTIYLSSLIDTGVTIIKVLANKDYNIGRGLAFSPDGKILASSYGNIISLWSIPECNAITAGSCVCDKVCSCDTVSPGNTSDVCTCNTIDACTCNTVCSCNTVCTCDSDSGGGGYYYTYWYPN
jgi:WD40 repeat protein